MWILWIALMIAMAGDLLISVIFPIRYPGYSILRDSISALGNPESPVRLPFNIWMLVEGLLFLASIPAFYQYYQPVSAGLTVTTIVFIAVFAIGACILTCFFSVNKNKDVVTTASKIHGVGSVIGFMLFLLVPLMVAILSFKNNEPLTGGVSVACFVLSLVSFTLFVMADKPEFSKTPVANEGLWQRLNLLFMYIPLAVIAISRISELLP